MCLKNAVYITFWPGNYCCPIPRYLNLFTILFIFVFFFSAELPLGDKPKKTMKTRN